MLTLGGCRKISCTTKGEKAGKGGSVGSRNWKECITQHISGELVVLLLVELIVD